MEEQIAPGQEQFSQFLMACISESGTVAEMDTKVCELYVSLLYGDPKTPREISFAFAQAHGIFRPEVALLTHQAMEKTQSAKLEFTKKYVKQEYTIHIYAVGNAT